MKGPDYYEPQDYWDDYGPDPEVEDARNNHGQDQQPTYKCACGALVYNDTMLMRNDYDGSLMRNDYDGSLHNCIEKVLGKPKEITMNSHVKVIARPIKGLLASSLAVGEYARVTETSAFTGHIVLKSRAGVVDITDPSIIWDSFTLPLVERLNTGDKLEIAIGITAEFEQSIRNNCNSGNKITAIKAVREATNWGLKESKDYVEALMLMLKS